MVEAAGRTAHDSYSLVGPAHNTAVRAWAAIEQDTSEMGRASVRFMPVVGRARQSHGRAALMGKARSPGWGAVPHSGSAGSAASAQRRPVSLEETRAVDADAVDAAVIRLPSHAHIYEPGFAGIAVSALTGRRT